jgi:hypothetical protein
MELLSSPYQISLQSGMSVPKQTKNNSPSTCSVKFRISYITATWNVQLPRRKTFPLINLSFHARRVDISTETSETAGEVRQSHTPEGRVIPQEAESCPRRQSHPPEGRVMPQKAESYPRRTDRLTFVHSSVLLIKPGNASTVLNLHLDSSKRWQFFFCFGY